MLMNKLRVLEYQEGQAVDLVIHFAPRSDITSLGDHKSYTGHRDVPTQQNQTVACDKAVE